jgi:DNA polymerase-1
MKPKSILLVDFNNMVYRARAGFGRGEHAIVYTFMLIMRKAVEVFDPSRVYIVKEGRPHKRYEAFPEYKAGRESAGDDFWRQHHDILSFMTNLPVHVVRHPDRECDDVIAHLADVEHAGDPVVIISTDSDFTQLLVPDDDRVRLWNPVKDAWVEATTYDYVMWKSLVGDGSDGIPGFKGVGGKTAVKLLGDDAKLKDFLSVEGRMEIFERNLNLIRFDPIVDGIEHSVGQLNPESIKEFFEAKGFTSLLKPGPWTKFVNTFANLN